MKTNFFGAALATALAVSAGAASASTLLYDESISGDLDAIGSTNVNIVLGANNILGSINATPPADTDRITFTQTAGLIIDSIVLSFGGTPFSDNSGQELSAALFNNVANLFDDNFSSIASSVSILASFLDSTGPETGPLSKDTDGAIWDFQLSAGTVYAALPWTLTINTSAAPVSAVPLPATAPLVLGALGGLALFRRRKSA